jgi:hypothetical protein
LSCDQRNAHARNDPQSLHRLSIAQAANVRNGWKADARLVTV